MTCHYPDLGRNHTLRRKRVRLVSEQRKAEERDFRVRPRAKNGTSATLIYSHHFRAAFDSRSSFFAPKPHGNACYAGNRNDGSRGVHKKSVNENFFPGLYPLVGWKIGGETVYLAEGNAAGCGTAMEWSRQMGKNLNFSI